MRRSSYKEEVGAHMIANSVVCDVQSNFALLNALLQGWCLSSTVGFFQWCRSLQSVVNCGHAND